MANWFEALFAGFSPQLNPRLEQPMAEGHGQDDGVHALGVKRVQIAPRAVHEFVVILRTPPLPT